MGRKSLLPIATHIVLWREIPMVALTLLVAPLQSLADSIREDINKIIVIETLPQHRERSGSILDALKENSGINIYESSQPIRPAGKIKSTVVTTEDQARPNHRSYSFSTHLARVSSKPGKSGCSAGLSGLLISSRRPRFLSE